MDEFPSEAEALVVLREALLAHGPEYISNLALTREDGEDSKLLAEGGDLVARLRAMDQDLRAPAHP